MRRVEVESLLQAPRFPFIFGTINYRYGTLVSVLLYYLDHIDHAIFQHGTFQSKLILEVYALHLSYTKLDVLDPTKPAFGAMGLVAAAVSF